MPIDTVEILRELVSIPSINPMGRGDLAPVGEARLTEHLAARLTALGLFVERQTVAPGRENILARLDGDPPPERGGGLLLFDAHQDTVPADNMTIEPWCATLREGRLYGRGACDVKGGMAAMIATLARLAAERPAGMPTILLSCPVDEEYQFSGVRALTAAWCDGKAPRLPDAAIVAEPTGLDVVVAHKGVIRWFCHTRGRAVHSSQPAQGDNAIYKMARVVTAIERYSKEIFAAQPGHALCGSYTLNVGAIQGGTSVNIVPEQCRIELEIRVPPGGDPQEARKELIEYLAREVGNTWPSPPAPLPQAGEGRVEHDAPYMEGPALSDETNPVLAERLVSIVRETTGDCQRRGVPYATHAAFYSGLGIPTVVFGPGAVEQAHTADEWISLDQLQQATDVLYRFIKRWKPL